MAKKYVKSRYWASVGYPESLPSNWKDMLIETGLRIAVSPLHDNDFNPDGEVKKEHYHFIFYYDGPTTYEAVKDLCDKFNMTIPIKLESIRGMYRYHIHIDNPEKYQYDDRDRILLNGFDANSVNELTKTELNKIKKDIINYIVENNVREYCDLLNQLMDLEQTDMFDVAAANTLLFNTFITSRRNKFKDALLGISYNT